MFMPSSDSFTAAETIILSGGILPPAAPAPRAAGVAAATLVDTETGWRPAGSLRRGDRVETWDGGLRRLTFVERVWLHPALCPQARLVRIPGGVLDLCDDLLLPPQQHLLLTDDIAEAVLGDPRALVPAAALVGHFGAAWVACERPVEIVRLGFAEEEVIFANTGAMIHCAARGAFGAARHSAFFPVLAADRATDLVALIEAGARTSDEIGPQTFARAA